MSSKQKEQFFKLLEKLFEDSINRSELDKLLSLFVSSQEIKTWPEKFGSRSDVEAKIFSRIKSTINNEGDTNKVISFYRRPFFKYAVAASVVLLIAFTYVFKLDKSISPDQIIVDNKIEAGTDRAVLTLEDGTQIALEQYESSIAENVVNNGKEIVYIDKASEEKTNVENSKAKLKYHALTIPRGGQYALTLADGTKVWLNSETKLKYPEKFIAGITREVELVYGEAYFDVSPSTEHNGARFKVLSKGQDVEVVGTEFNVKAYNDERMVYTTLVEGKVVVSDMASRIILKPNQQAINNLNGIEVLNIDAYYETSWKEGAFKFKNKSLKQIMKVLSRWYDINVVFDNKELEYISFKGTIGKEQQLEEILSSIQATGYINSYKITGQTVILE